MVGLSFLVFCFTLLSLLCQQSSVAIQIITSSQSLSDGKTIVSQGESFELGFFSPVDSKNRYIGIWYKTIPLQTVVWVANRNSPLNDSSGVLKIEFNGNLVLHNGANNVIWSSNYLKATENPVVELLDSGNLVLKDGNDGNSTSYLWQSFDYPSDTLLPGMKLGWDLKTGFNRYLSAWNGVNDPSVGDLTYGIINFNRYPEAAMMRNSKEYYRSGPWNGLRYSGAPELKPNPVFKFDFVSNEDEVYYTYGLNDNSVISRLVLNQTSGNPALQRFTWAQRWVLLISIPRDLCDTYRNCGAYGSCDINDAPICSCLKGLKPRSPLDWNKTDYSLGCIHETPLNCTKGDRFVKFTGVKLPETTKTWVNKSMDLEECKVKCLMNCSCTAYTTSNISGDGSGCVIWLGDLFDIRQFNTAGQDIYIRMLASEIDGHYYSEDVPFMTIRRVLVTSIPNDQFKRQ
ncbi:hypothetical protein GIB67_017348 [Kingdonia uniflora]|uniref:Uncharacterized protein n=1 Tax=Kingdonia uniflora TaxID=39325 RepID=A0A7J7MPP7_9MAGN|nr:hypothetical protein GIB67_017348 [Kingdonia uniflora]